jgi:transcriptional regulator with XRE-family HTH domain
LKQEQEKKGISLQDLCRDAAIPSAELTAYLQNREPIPFSKLLSILVALQLPLDQLFASETAAPQEVNIPLEQNAGLPANLSAEMVEFISKPANLPYLELAMRFSKMDADKIRTIASSLLEITY